jgi:elongation factor 1-gamma
METPFGPLYESGAILKYIARLRADTNLFGINFYENALVEQWLDWCAFEVEPARYICY